MSKRDEFRSLMEENHERLRRDFRASLIANVRRDVPEFRNASNRNIMRALRKAMARSARCN